VYDLRLPAEEVQVNLVTGLWDSSLGSP